MDVCTMSAPRCVLAVFKNRALTRMTAFSLYPLYRLTIMPLFRDHPIRSTVAVVGALTIGQFLTRSMSSLHAFHLTQTSVAILAIASLVFLVTMHHRREGRLLTQTQEEMVLICGFGLFWIAVLLGWRAMTQRAADPGRTGEISLSSASTGRAREPGFGGGIRPYPCTSDDLYCVVEDWTFY